MADRGTGTLVAGFVVTLSRVPAQPCRAVLVDTRIPGNMEHSQAGTAPELVTCYRCHGVLS
jgi:uncharacterized protein YcfJ